MRISDWSSDVCSSDLLVTSIRLSQEPITHPLPREGGLEFHRRSVALSPETWSSLKKIAQEEGITTSELVRSVLILFLADRDRPQFNPKRIARSAASRVGKECVRTSRTRGSTYHKKKN